MSQKTITGATARVVIIKNGKQYPIGYATDINATIDETLTKIEVLDDPTAKEHAYTHHNVSLSVSYFKIASNKLSSPGLGFNYTSASALIKREEFTLQILDTTEAVPVPVAEIIGCKYEGGSFTVAARAVMTATANFQAKQYKDL